MAGFIGMLGKAGGAMSAAKGAGGIMGSMGGSGGDSQFMDSLIGGRENKKKKGNTLQGAPQQNPMSDAGVQRYMQAMMGGRNGNIR